MVSYNPTPRLDVSSPNEAGRPEWEVHVSYHSSFYVGGCSAARQSHGVNPYILKKNMILMTNHFYAAILGYDEGILSDDHGLAAALWRTFFNGKCEDPRHLELLVEYVRKQMQYLDSMNGEDLLLTGEVSWRPLVEKNPQSILKPHSPTYNDEGL